MTKFSKNTNALHVGHDANSVQGSIAVPIYQNTAYAFKNTDHAAKVFALKEFDFLYTRLNNPTNDVLEKRLASIEGGIAANVFASGTSANLTTFLTLLKNGDHIVSGSSLYGGTFNMLNITLPRLGIDTTFANPDNINNFENAIQDNTKCIFVESLGNPRLDVLDLEKIAKIAQKHKIPFIVDNTVATPALLNPIEYGANIVTHSLTKYIDGTGSSLGGVVIDGGNFDWSSGKFPEFTGQSKAYHGINYHENFGNLAFFVKLRIEGLRDIGASLSPQNAFQILQGLRTLDLRIKKHSKNALELAKWLEDRDEVLWVNYPGLKNSKYYNLAQKYLPQAQSGILTFGVKGGYEASKKVTDATKLFSLVANFGDSKSLIIHPASTTHQQLSTEEKLSAGVSEDLIRLSVGLEDVNDLKTDLLQAFNSLK